MAAHHRAHHDAVHAVHHDAVHSVHHDAARAVRHLPDWHFCTVVRAGDLAPKRPYRLPTVTLNPKTPKPEQTVTIES
jgi:hypothetical protein